MALCDKVRIEGLKVVCTKENCMYNLSKGKCFINYEKPESSDIDERLEVYENNQSPN